MDSSSSPQVDESYGRIMKDMRSASPAVLRKTAKDVFESKSVTLDGNPHPEDRLPKFDARELNIGRVLGRGAFCVVQECSLGNASGTLSLGSGSSRGSAFGLFSSFGSRKNDGGGLNANSNHSGDGRSREGSEHDAAASARSATPTPTTTRRNRKNKTRYVIKQLSPDLKHGDKISFLKGTVDLAMETRLLAAMDHENIVSLHGTSSNDAFSDGYFIILERVNETLGRRVKKWMDMDRQCKGITGVFTGSKKKLLRLESERLSAAYDLAVGMNYLHQRNIVFRDLKPDNVGFDYVGVLKIFDFGLAKELRDDERNSDGLYNMTGCTGAVRYMSPENALSQPYNLTTDVYSWAMIMWFILALEPPFALYTEKMIIERVTERGYRPKVFSSWSPRMVTIMNRSWHAVINERPSFAEIATTLRMELAELDPNTAAILQSTGEEQGLPGVQEVSAEFRHQP